ncbi:putative esterase [Gordonia araii NBRC 100433]|uniref:Putative esterase n=1 Tax=Gordonia araii NBRC 100433 TaxID=1073574 RepID=G7GZZ6_9ACTN|nr:serine hydrolase domain-containing protein [Gordonia araii]NNG98350.1 beta-lactamase family protein [Gordonia araii NBRC 100433]GAB09171.1 putative esterase [Gordonia araii NBRC 100433]
MTVQGETDPRFERVRSAFGRLFAGRINGGGALCVYEDGVPVVDIWGGTSDRRGEIEWAPSTGAMLYSASKGLSALVVHRLADRGLIDYDEPVATYWPEFAATSGERITVRKLMLHRGGLSQLRGIAGSVSELLDHELMQARLASAMPDRHYGEPAYHALTFGWLMAGLAGSVTGKSMRELWASELAEPLGIDELSLGAPPAGSPLGLAEIVDPFKLGNAGLRDPVLATMSRLPGPLGAMAGGVTAGPGSARLFKAQNPAILQAEMSAANGVASARAMARIYAPLATDGTVDGQRFLSEATVASFEAPFRWKRDRALGLPMSWNHGFHRAPIPVANGFGHVGYSGCFGWADRASGVSVGFVHNRLTSTVVGDLGIFLWLLPMITKAAAQTKAPVRPGGRRLSIAS